MIQKNLLYYRSKLVAVVSVENLLASFELKSLLAMDSTQILVVRRLSARIASCTIRLLSTLLLYTRYVPTVFRWLALISHVR
jgi:hypothetical protein